jgi:hypothetical protein
MCRTVSFIEEKAMKQRGDKILVHVASPLKAQVEALAKAEGRSVSDYVRRLLLDVVTRRVAKRGEVAA